MYTKKIYSVSYVKCVLTLAVHVVLTGPFRPSLYTKKIYSVSYEMRVHTCGPCCAHRSLAYNKIVAIQEDGWECCKKNLNRL